MCIPSLAPHNQRRLSKIEVKKTRRKFNTLKSQFYKNCLHLLQNCGRILNNMTVKQLVLDFM